MARTVREAALATRSARLRLANSKPYWRLLEQGLHLGYRRRATGGSWIARRRNDEGIYREAKLGLADDLQDANSPGIVELFIQSASLEAKAAIETARGQVAALCHDDEIVCALFGPGQVATIHLSAAHRSTPIFERLFCDFEVELYGDATIPKNGKIKVPTGPGLGLEPVSEALEKFRLSV